MERGFTPITPTPLWMVGNTTVSSGKGEMSVKEECDGETKEVCEAKKEEAGAVGEEQGKGGGETKNETDDEKREMMKSILIELMDDIGI